MKPQFKRTCDMLSTALDMEKKGKAFYQRAGKKCKDPKCRDVFKMLADLEVEHIERIRKIYESLESGEGWCDWDEEGTHPDLGQVFRELTFRHGADITADSTDLEALDTGLGLEKESISFYQEAAKKATDKEEKEFLKAMVGEEKMHHQSLADMRLYLENPAAWFAEQEKPHLDGA
ncbi:MAG TPA: ferritin family protein [bacterium]|nr:ferritin family protein [bacterium]